MKFGKTKVEFVAGTQLRPFEQMSVYERWIDSNMDGAGIYFVTLQTDDTNASNTKMLRRVGFIFHKDPRHKEMAALFKKGVLPFWFKGYDSVEDANHDMTMLTEGGNF